MMQKCEIECGSENLWPSLFESVMHSLELGAQCLALLSKKSTAFGHGLSFLECVVVSIFFFAYFGLIAKDIVLNCPTSPIAT